MADDDAGSYEVFVALFTRHEAELRAFTRALLPRWQDVDEVMQRTAVVLWWKFAQFERGSEFLRWACVVARFEVLAYRRQMARDRLVFSENVMALLAEQAAEEMAGGAARREERVLERCVEKLPENQRELVTLAYTADANLAEVATRQGRKPGTIYMALNRIRAALLDCVERELQREEPA